MLFGMIFIICPLYYEMKVVCAFIKKRKVVCVCVFGLVSLCVCILSGWLLFDSEKYFRCLCLCLVVRRTCTCGWTCVSLCLYFEWVFTL